MSKLVCIFTLGAALVLCAMAATAQTAIPDLRGTWKGESESLVLNAGNPHHPPASSNEPELRSVAFTLVVDKQEGRRFSGTFSSARSSEKVIAVISRGGTIFLADDEGRFFDKQGKVHARISCDFTKEFNSLLQVPLRRA